MTADADIHTSSPSAAHGSGRVLRDRDATRIAHRPRPALAASARGQAKHQYRLQREMEALEAFSAANEALAKVSRRSSSSASPAQTQSQPSIVNGSSQRSGCEHQDCEMAANRAHTSSQKGKYRLEEAQITIETQERDAGSLVVASNGPPGSADATRAVLEAAVEMDEDALLAGAEDEFDDSSYWEDDENVDWDAIQVPDTTEPRVVPNSPPGVIRWANKRSIASTDRAEEARRKFQRMIEMSDDEERAPLGEIQVPTTQSPAHLGGPVQRLSTPSKPSQMPAPSTSQRRLGSTPRTNAFINATSSLLQATPVRRSIGLGTTPRRMGTSSVPFRSPFLKKAGVEADCSVKLIPVVSTARPAMTKVAEPVFSLYEPDGRTTLRQLSSTSSWHWSGVHDEDDERRDVRAILSDPHCARRFLFDGRDGVEEARTALAAAASAEEASVSLDWVRNHYGLIVWKLAALAFHCVEQRARFTWDEVVRQLRYRYERECNRSQRSAIKMIQERDASVSRPMVLCVYDASIDDQEPSLTLTDGWYRIQACISGPLQRAVQKGKIKVGCKLAIGSAQLVDDEVGCDPLQGFLTSRISLSGNSVKLARWDTKLGFSRARSFATLRSLTADGGLVPMMDLVVVRAYPKAFMDESSYEQASGSATQGSQRQQGYPSAWNEAEEQEKREEWKQKREALMDGVAGLMEEQAGKLRNVVQILNDACEDLSTDETPFQIDSSACEGQLDAMLATSDPSRYLSTTAVLPTLLSLARTRLEALYGQASEEKARLIETQCPKRSVRSFQILRVCDAAVAKARGVHDGTGLTASARLLACKRDALLRVWDVSTMEEDAQFGEGNRYQVSNLQPYKTGAWPSGIDDVDDIHLTTRRDSRWTQVAFPFSSNDRA